MQLLIPTTHLSGPRRLDLGLLVQAGNKMLGEPRTVGYRKATEMEGWSTESEAVSRADPPVETPE